MKKIFFGSLALAMLGVGSAMAADMPVKTESPDMTALCRLPSAANALLVECAGLSFSVGGLDIKRERTQSTIITPSSGPGTILTSGDFDFSRSWSPDLKMQWRFGNGWALEARYFNSRPPNASYDIPDIDTFRIGGIGVTILGGGSVDTTYLSHLSSFEFNFSKEVMPGISLLGGYRSLALHENLLVNIANVVPVQWDDTNSMQGLQAGVDLSFVSPVVPLHFDLALKEGSLWNSAVNQLTSGIISGATGTDSRSTYTTEFDLSMKYYVTSRLSVEASFMSLWLKGVALADAAASTTTQVAGGSSSPVHFANIWYNGASLAMAYDF